MSPRQQRLAEYWQARRVLDAKINAMSRDGMDGTWNDDPLPPPALWRDVAHANKNVIDGLIAVGVRHIKHDLGTIR